MNSGKLIALLVVAAALIGGGWYVYKQQNSAKPAVEETGGLNVGDTLLSKLETMVDGIARIEYAQGDESLALVKKGESEWVVDSSGGYPADASKVSKLVYDLLDLKVGNRLTKKKEKYAKFGLDSDPAVEGSLKILDSSGEVIVALHRGNQREASGSGRGGGRFLLRNGDANVYLVDENLYSLNATLTSWVETEFCKVDTDAIQQVTINHGSTETFSADWSSGAPKIDSLTAGMKQKDYEYNNIRGALNGLRLTNVFGGDSETAKALDFQKDQFVAKAKDGSVYHVDTATSGSSYYIKMNAEYGEMITTTADKATTQALALAMANAEKAKAEVPMFNERHGIWVYEVSSYYFNRFTKKRSEMIEPIPEPKADTKAEGMPIGGAKIGGGQPPIDFQQLLNQQKKTTE